MRWKLCVYDKYSNKGIMGKKKTQHEKQKDMRLAKCLGFIQRVCFNTPGFSCKVHEHCAEWVVTP